MIKPTGIWFDVNRAADGSFDIEPVKSVKALHQAPVADDEEKPELILPETTKPDRVKLYLTLERMLSERLVDAYPSFAHRIDILLGNTYLRPCKKVVRKPTEEG